MLFNPEVEKKRAGLYIHIPFCKQACHYCNFHFSTHLPFKAVVLGSIQKELFLRKSYFASMPVATIYIGGGTPSLATLLEMEQLLHAIFTYFPVAVGAEITLEANPDDVTLEKLKGWRSMGINRLSIGIQSFNDRVLHFMHRAHTGFEAQKAIEWARVAAFDNLNLDLMYAIPSTTASDWQADLDKAVALAPEHISAYCLTIEDKTAFGHWHKQGKLIETEEEVSAEQFEQCLETLMQKGYIHYEIANFCQPGRFSEHNKHYWKKGPYLGIGPGAHSYNGTHRHWNVANNALYVKSIQNDIVPCTEELLTVANHINEYIMTSIRTCWGCDFDWLYHTYAVNLMAMHKDYIDQILSAGFAYLDQNKLLLTNSGKLVADKIASELFVDAADPQQGVK
ncbi:MAG TPA: radical SAM family heme chaperone HemW [Amoebophilaceae bacterium]|nr:radical SAM family heme chaperone HemW [Amoebophilaceae bacterium]